MTSQKETAEGSGSCSLPKLPRCATYACVPALSELLLSKLLYVLGEPTRKFNGQNAGFVCMCLKNQLPI